MAQITKSIKSEKSQIDRLRDEVGNLREEIKYITSLLVGDRMESVANAISSKHLKLYSDREISTVEDSVSKGINQSCGNHDKCRNRFTGSLKEILGEFGSSGIDASLLKISNELDRIDSVLAEKQGTSCFTCNSHIKSELVRHRDTLKLLSPGMRPVQGAKREIDYKKITETVLKPVANPVRLQILVSLYQGRLSFSELASHTNMRGGQLIFHMNQLLKSGFIIQAGKKGDYVITEKGMEILDKLNSI
jgi:predicted transcriptional regulator